MPFNKQHALIVFAVVFLSSCARVVSPTGGDKDILPPELENSIPANKSTNFDGTELILNFNEYIGLDNPSQNIIVAPLPKNKVQYKVKGKSVVVAFDETLLENTTYSIFFGNSIKDVNEGNVLSNYSFVFSTGDKLDSLKISGKVKYASSDQPAENIKILAYEALSDSSVLTSRPTYISISDANGNYSFQNLPEKAFRIFALDDKNGNLIKDLPNEGFDYSEIEKSSIDSSTTPTLRIFESDIDLKKKKHTFYKNQVLAVIFNQEALGKNKLFTTNSGQDITVLAGMNESDSILLQLSNPLTDTIINSTTSDSIAIGFSDRNKDYPSSWKITGNGVLWDSLFIQSSLPFAATDTFQICGVKDSSNYCLPLKLASKAIDNRSILILPSFLDSIVSGKSIWLKPGSVAGLTPFEKNTNDSIHFGLQKPDSSSFGKLTLTITNSELLQGYVVLKSSDKEIQRISLPSQKGDVVLNSPLLQAGKYSLLFVQDANLDGKWTSGEYTLDTKYKAEITIAYPEEISVRSNWELDLEWDLTFTEE